MVLDARNQVITWNSAAEDILGYSAEEALGRPCFELLQGIDHYGNPVCFPGCAVITCTRRHQEVRHFGLSVKGKSGQRQWVDVSIIPLCDSDGRLVALVHLLRATSAPDRFERLIENALVRVSISDPQLAPPATLDPLHKLTSREREIVNLLAEGASTSLIAKRLVITPKTVRNHIERILGKLNVHSRLEAIALVSTPTVIRGSHPNGTIS